MHLREHQCRGRAVFAVTGEHVHEIDAEQLVAVEREDGPCLVPLRRRQPQAAAATERLLLTDGHDLWPQARELALEDAFVSRCTREDHPSHSGIREPADLVGRQWAPGDRDERLRAPCRRAAEPLGLAAREDQRFHYAFGARWRSRCGDSGRTSVGEPARPTPSYAKPAARVSSGSSMFRPSTISGCFIALRTSSLTTSLSSGHSVTITAASAPATASNGDEHSCTPWICGLATGSHARTVAPSAINRAASTSDGASRMSSVLGLKASPSSAIVLPRSLPRCFCSFWTTRRFWSSLTAITAFSSWECETEFASSCLSDNESL